MERDGGMGDSAEDLLDLFQRLGGLDEHHQIQVEGPGVEGVQVHQGLARNELPMERAPHQIHDLEEGEGVESGAINGAGEFRMHTDHRLALDERRVGGGPAGLADPGQDWR